MYNENAGSRLRPLTVALATLDFLTLREKFTLLNSLSSLEDLCSLSPESISAVSGRDTRMPSSRAFKMPVWNGDDCLRLTVSGLKTMEALGVKAVFYGDPGYPPMLSEISDPPFALFYRGSLDCLEAPSVSLVGTRRITPDGRRAARDFAFDAASCGVCVVSGLAAGVDGEAHRGALDAFYAGLSAAQKNPQLKKDGDCVLTAAVLAAGIDNIYPSFHKKIAAQIIQGGGCLLSEYPPGLPAEKWRFVRRNRIVAGLTPATIVIQAPPGSGAMITADFALGYGRDVFFHKACFSQSAKKVSDMVVRNLTALNGAAAKRKIQMCPGHFVGDGAPVIESFSEIAVACPGLFFID